MCACEGVCRCVPTWLPAVVGLLEAGALTQPVEPLLFDQLHDLRLDLLPQLSGTHTHTLS